MGRVEEIIVKARDTLADPNGDRWADERLIRLIDEAQKDVCRRAKLLRTRKDIAIYNGRATYTLPSDMLLLDRVLLNGDLLPFKSHLEMDRSLSVWEDDTGMPQYLVYDKQNRQEVKLYPIPANLAADTYTFSSPGYFEDTSYVLDAFGTITDAPTGDSIAGDYGFTTDVDYIDYLFNQDSGTCDPYTFLDAEIDSDYGIVSVWTTEIKDTGEHDENYGVVVGIEGLSQNSDYGVLVSLKQDGITVENFDKGDYGVTTDISETFDSLTVYYLKKPTSITSLGDDIEIDDSFDSALKYYVVGKALRDDMDTQNRTVGNEELQFYDRELRQAIKDDVVDFTRSVQYKAKYQGAFNG